MKSNKKGFYKDISQGKKKKAKESVPLLLLNEKRELATADREKAQILGEFFASHFSGCQASCVS